MDYGMGMKKDKKKKMTPKSNKRMGMMYGGKREGKMMGGMPKSKTSSAQPVYSEVMPTGKPN